MTDDLSPKIMLYNSSTTCVLMDSAHLWTHSLYPVRYLAPCWCVLLNFRQCLWKESDDTSFSCSSSDLCAPGLSRLMPSQHIGCLKIAMQIYNMDPLLLRLLMQMSHVAVVIFSPCENPTCGMRMCMDFHDRHIHFSPFPFGGFLTFFSSPHLFKTVSKHPEDMQIALSRSLFLSKHSYHILQDVPHKLSAESSRIERFSVFKANK